MGSEPLFVSRGKRADIEYNRILLLIASNDTINAETESPNILDISSNKKLEPDDLILTTNNTANWTRNNDVKDKTEVLNQYINAFSSSFTREDANKKINKD